MIKQIIDNIKDRISGKVPSGTKRSNKWPEARAAHLKIEPLCQVCGTTEKLQAHHLKPFHLHPELELDPKNLITLCEKPGRNHHILFGHLMNFKSFNVNCKDDVDQWQEKIKNRPTGDGV